MDGMEVNLSRAIDFFYPSSSSLELVYFEAIANAIDAGANNIQISIPFSQSIRYNSHKGINIHL